MTENILIRKAKQTDFEAIYKFVNALEESIFPLENQKKAFERNLADGDFIYLIAELNNKPIGFISCYAQEVLHHGAQRIAEIQEMYVSPENRKSGVGKKLLDELKKIAKQNGIVQLEVTSNKKRTETHQFYLRECFLNSHEKFTFELK